MASQTVAPAGRKIIPLQKSRTVWYKYVIEQMAVEHGQCKGKAGSWQRHWVTPSPCHPSPPYVAFGDIWGQMEAMDNGQWTVDSGQ